MKVIGKIIGKEELKDKKYKEVLNVSGVIA